ncbi:hypothetical protein VCUG_01283 [Vavraia culicis subsp. floridensis]|uniref:Uncharacterized protein n=1 Tax=Vavraia culicis (isolate floridensis) TaxID=948595 RepID=L2GV54_VAVCU|nr:uncharacterized protein VCUG_01283 [Vavraia culicis subsp. floridensis]ELA47183.1 hypothetical protein VCUG_01283 [Vavraia culicis subsp. floridensis]
MHVKPTVTYKPDKSHSADYITASAHTNNLWLYGTCTGKVLAHSNNAFYEYTSHVQSFDYLESMEIAENVCALEVHDNGNGRMMVVSANERNIRIDEVEVGRNDEIVMMGIECTDGKDEEGVDCDFDHNLDGTAERTSVNTTHILTTPACTTPELHPIPACTTPSPAIHTITPTPSPAIHTITPTPINTALVSELDAHSYNIHSLSLRNHFLLSSDYFCIDIHNIHRMKQSVLNLINIKPANLDNLGSVITKCTYFSYDTFLYALSSGRIYLNDMRASVQSKRTHQFSYQPDSYREILSAVSDISVVDDRSFVARNLNTVVLYDVRNDKSHVETYEVFKADAKSIQRVCTQELVYERMHCVYDCGRIVTGDFDGNFYVFGMDGERVCVKGEGMAKVIGCKGDDIAVCGDAVRYYKMYE